jgi:hypothetical protein
MRLISFLLFYPLESNSTRCGQGNFLGLTPAVYPNPCLVTHDFHTCLHPQPAASGAIPTGTRKVPQDFIDRSA